MTSGLTSAIRFSVCAVIGAFLVIGAYGQNVQSSTPPPGDPEVFGLFLRSHDSLTKDIENLRSTNPQAAQSLQQRMAASIGISVSDYVTVNTIYRAMKAQFDALDTEAANIYKLPPAAWNGLHAFINQEHRLSLHTGRPPIAPPR
jgi:hypothetical protein